MSSLGHVVLVGLPGSGKSTIAPLLAARLGRPAADIDAEVEAELGRSVPAIFAELGEPRFRAEELAMLHRALAAPEPRVISAGGGLIAQRGADALLRQATVVWLDAADGILAERIASAAPRPLLGAAVGERLAALRSERSAAYAQAQLHVQTGDSTPDAVAGRLAADLCGAVRVGTDRPYLVTVARGGLARIADHLPPPCRRVLLIADQAIPGVTEGVATALRDRGLTVLVSPVPGGESLKSWDAAGRLLAQCSEAALDRDDCIVAVGGGTVGDVAGFVAAVYLRGIAWVVVPTTLLSMVDSAVGGKTAVNLARGKNLAGCFWQPRAVLCDSELLGTVPEAGYRSAFAEIVKSAMVGGGELPALVESRLPGCLARDADAVAAVVRGCCAFKADVIAGDEREHGQRAILNYGHTVGHAVETLTGLGEGLDHGEAVAYGMRVAGVLSVGSAGCPAEDIEWQNGILDRCGLTRRPALAASTIVGALGGDKKARGGVPRWVLVRGRGRPVSGVVLEADDVRAAIAEVSGQ